MLPHWHAPLTHADMNKGVAFFQNTKRLRCFFYKKIYFLTATSHTAVEIKTREKDKIYLFLQRNAITSERRLPFFHPRNPSLEGDTRLTPTNCTRLSGLWTNPTKINDSAYIIFQLSHSLMMLRTCVIKFLV